jgi:Protein of unknown function (DUF1592)/Protein of unknown function (DUF1588)/Protein of unknown function (DUF1595)/Protein of unknown function (DUF1587)
VRPGRAAVLSCSLAVALAACAPLRSNGPAGTRSSPTPAALPAATGRSTPEGASARCATSALAPRALRRLTREELESAIRDVFPSLGAGWSGADLGPDPLSELGFDNDAGALLVGEQTAREILSTAKEVAALVTAPAHLPAVLACAAAADQACAERFIDDQGPRLYRRPLAADERAELVSTYRSVSGRAGFALGLKWALVAMLESPAFLYRSELGDAAGKLDPYEIATELAFTYGGSTPSPELAAKAAAGALATPAALAAEARALLGTPRGADALREFFREWSGYERVLGVDKAAVGMFPTRVAPLLAEETRRFLDAVVVDGDGSVATLLTSETTFLDSDLAIFYGYGAGVGDFAPVARPAGRGIGLLAQASILASRSHYDFTSPTFRGLFVYSQFLCRQPLARPVGVHAVQDAPAAETTRARYETMHAQGSCAGCHQLFEPFGYGLEHFDAAGLYRENENGYPLDTHAAVALDPSTTLEFDGLEDLARKLAARPEVTDCVSGLLTSYAFGGGGGQSCLAEEGRARLARGELGLRGFYLSLASAPSFTARAP